MFCGSPRILRCSLRNELTPIETRKGMGVSLYDEMKSRLRLMTGGLNPARGVAEDTSPRAIREIDERLVQMIWHEQLIDAGNLTACSKKPLRVHEPGQWNSGAGPDFRLADLEIGGQRMRGDVEIHLNSGDWERHKHDRDFEYNSVILHVFLRRDDTANHDVLHNGNTVERLELEPFVRPDLDTVRHALAAEDFASPASRAATAPCQAALEQLDQPFLRDFFTAAARQRMETKIARFAAQRAGESPDQTLYQAVMTAMGHKGGKTLYFLLAKRVPIVELKDYLSDTPDEELPTAIESILLNVANLAAAPQSTREGGSSEPCTSPPYDAETQEHLNAINRCWSALSGYYRDRMIPPTRRWFAGIRPVNFPGRRIAGVARLLVSLDFRRGLADTLVQRAEQAMARDPRMMKEFKRETAALISAVTVEHDSYWSRRFTLGGKPAARPAHLIGAGHAASVFFNAALPILILCARETGRTGIEDFAWRLFMHYPALPGNTITRHMRARLFGAPDAAPKWLDFRFERANQALFQIYYDCCGNPARATNGCMFSSRLCQ